MLKIILFSYSLNIFSAEIAFIKAYKRDGRPIIFENDGDFVHVAIKPDSGSLKNKWIHTHPFRGVEALDSLDQIGFYRFNYKVLKVRDESVDLKFIEEVLGKNYDHDYDWSNDSYYCSEFIAKALSLEPMPMNFDSRFWEEKYQKLNGKPGLSPMELFRKILQLQN
jgi:hypothetical protein